MTEEDAPKVTSLLTGISNQVSMVTKYMQSILKRVKNGECQTSKGVSFLEIKQQMILSYLINLTYLMLRKTEGKKIEGDQAIDRLVEIRTVLEKMRPIDQKIRYQVDKLIKTAAVGEVAPNDPRRFKPNPDNLVSKLETDSEAEEEDPDKKEDGQRKYVAPKVSAMHFDGDLTVEERKERYLEKAKKRALSSSLLQELKDEYYEGPAEISEETNTLQRRRQQAVKHQQEFEESNFMRFPITRKDKNLEKKRSKMTGLEGLTRFDDISALTHEMGNDDDDLGPAHKKKKTPSKLRKGNKKQLSKRKKRFKKT